MVETYRSEKNKRVKVEEIHQMIEYDTTSPSHLVWKQSSGKKMKAGSRCGYLDKKRGYWLTNYKGKKYKVHRLIWELFNGPIPEGLVIDHIEGKDNSIENLRLATTFQNARNSERSKSKAGDLPKGIRVKKSDGYMEARIFCENKRYRKHSYDLDTLVEWLGRMRESLHGEFAKV